MTHKRPTPRALNGVQDRIAKLPAATSSPYASLDTADPVERFTTLCELDEWTSFVGRNLSPSVDDELAELAPTLAATEITPSGPLPTSGPLAYELAKIDAELDDLRSKTGRDTEPLYYSPELWSTITRTAMRMKLSWVVYDGREGQAEINARHEWYQDRKNLAALAERLGYEVS